MTASAPASRSTPPRAWVRLPSGRRLDLLDPTPFDFEPSDLALGAARTCRWGGHSVWEWPLSVAQHSLLVLEIGRSFGPLTPQAALSHLLHDASECLGVCFDPISPLKPFLGDGYHQLDRRLQAVVQTRFGLPNEIPPTLKKRIKRADRLAAAAEAVHVAGWSEAESRSILGIRLPLLPEDPLIARFGGTPWQPWPASLAAERFLSSLTALLAA
jgi:5'-deoxynucleotidase YfbR-like HD superfamily hydrolase